MEIIEPSTGKVHQVVIKPVQDEDYKTIMKKKYFFNWKTEKSHQVFKLMISGTDTILGLMSCITDEKESRVRINLLAVSIENRGKEKQYEGIAGILITFACQNAKAKFGLNACVNLVPKTKLRPHYKLKYGMEDAGESVALTGLPLMRMIFKYDP
jgi:hypothetical protein